MAPLRRHREAVHDAERKKANTVYKCYIAARMKTQRRRFTETNEALRRGLDPADCLSFEAEKMDWS